MNILLGALTFTAGVITAFGAEVTPAPSAPSSRNAEDSRVQTTLFSDGETWVSITGVQAPERFQSRIVSLPPGEYVVVGRRRGYRDVQMRLQLRSGSEPQTLRVVCTER